MKILRDDNGRYLEAYGLRLHPCGGGYWNVTTSHGAKLVSAWATKECIRTMVAVIKENKIMGAN